MERCLACEADSVGTVEFWSVEGLGVCSTCPRMHFDIIWLNGTSSSGKTTLAKELQTVLDDHFLHVCFDAFYQMVPLGSSHRPRPTLSTSSEYIWASNTRSLPSPKGGTVSSWTICSITQILCRAAST